MKKAYPDLIVVDGGNFGQSVSSRVSWKTGQLLNAMKGVGYDAVCLGDRDLYDEISADVASFNAGDLIFSSLHKAKDRLNVPEHKIIERSGVKIGLISAVSPSINRRVSGTDYEVESFIRAQHEQIKSQQVDFSAVIFLGPKDELLDLSKKISGIDLWLEADGDRKPIRQYDSSPKTMVISGGDRGRELGFVTVEKEQGAGVITGQFNQIILDDHIKDATVKAKPYIDSYRDAAEKASAAYKPASQSTNGSKS